MLANDAIHVSSKRSTQILARHAKKCIDKRRDDKKYVERKENNKETRVAANSKVPLCALNGSEQTERLLNLKFDRFINHKALRRAAKKFTKVEEK